MVDLPSCYHWDGPVPSHSARGRWTCFSCWRHSFQSLPRSWLGWCHLLSRFATQWSSHDLCSRCISGNGVKFFVSCLLCHLLSWVPFLSCWRHILARIFQDRHTDGKLSSPCLSAFQSRSMVGQDDTCRADSLKDSCFFFFYRSLDFSLLRLLGCFCNVGILKFFQDMTFHLESMHLFKLFLFNAW